ncbi:MAG: ABC transporter permease [Spirochaetaceae bacterium]|jgi:simple sugar transport system permease protein|nr:ABC transporter permease [Spirochaetaceae bacterium]
MKTEKKAFLFKNLTVETRFEILRFSAAVLISLVLTLIIILLVSREPARALSSLFLGPLSSPRRFANVIELAVTLTFAGLAVSVMFSANQFNMGAEGGFYASAAVAAMAAITLPLPPVLLPLAAIIAGMAAGALVCVTPAFLKGKWGASELVSSLMLNYAFFYIAKYCVFTNFRDPAAGQLATFPIPAAARLANIVPGTRINTGLFIVIAAVVVTAVFVRRTVWGYALVQTGRSPKFAAYSGINTQAVLYYSQIIGGALAGMGGAVEVLGLYERFTWQTLPGYGFDGIIVSILAKNKPQFVPLAAFLLAYLRIGADRMSTGSDVTSEMISIIQGIIIMLVAAQAFMAGRRQKMLLKEAAGA